MCVQVRRERSLTQPTSIQRFCDVMRCRETESVIRVRTRGTERYIGNEVNAGDGNAGVSDDEGYSTSTR
jgi:hypothetical protein